MTTFCMWVDIQEIIASATFGDDRLRGLGVVRGRISHFPIDLRRRPYNSRTTARVCMMMMLMVVVIMMMMMIFEGVEHKWRNSGGKGSVLYTFYLRRGFY